MKKSALALFLLITAVWIYFLWVEKINQWGLAILMVTTAISIVFLYNIEGIRKFFLKGGGYEFGAEWEKIKGEVYAKAEEVKKMGEEVAEVAAFNINNLGRWAPPNLTELIVEHRDKLVAMLENLKSDPRKIKKIIEPINQTVLKDLERAVVSVVNNTMNEKITQIEIKNKIVEEMRQEDALLPSVHFSDQIIINKIVEKIRQYFKSYELNKTKNELTEYLKSIDCYSTEIEEPLDRYEYFLENKNLK